MMNSFNCSCSSCEKFTKLVIEQPEIGTHLHSNNSNLFKKANSKHWIKIGDRVIVKDKFKGIVKYVGPMDDDLLVPQLYVGIKLDEPFGSDAGIFNGRWYFEAPLGFGMMAKYKDVKRVKPPDKRPPIYGNKMYPSCRLPRCSNSKQDTNSRSICGRSSTNDSSISNKKTLVRRITHKQIGTNKRQLTKPKAADELPPRLRHEVSKWKQDSTIKQPDIMKTTLTKLYLARERGKMEVQETARDTMRSKVADN
ncbi:uncharacterized protein [Amphiura filiformis]|uniref:uncharacterized protein n=1 Tax=Amphiura filiformis TaxID=82378 RepID=UPI003B21930C